MDEDTLACYRIGQEHENRVRREDNEIAVEAYKKAIELDPNYALAYAGLTRAPSILLNRIFRLRLRCALKPGPKPHR